jgi:hypothetical protein
LVDFFTGAALEDAVDLGFVGADSIHGLEELFCVFPRAVGRPIVGSAPFAAQGGLRLFQVIAAEIPFDIGAEIPPGVVILIDPNIPVS